MRTKSNLILLSIGLLLALNISPFVMAQAGEDVHGRQLRELLGEAVRGADAPHHP